MSDVIHLLPDSVANQIAAGEVIQRPASVLKELVENAIDAGASHIRIVMRDAGRTLIQVTDNGKGMSETDARMAFERHATSKINDAMDLFAIRTMGFRGEALASIAAVAQVEMRTRREEDELGTLIEIAGSRFFRQESVQCHRGTSFMVKNLFFNVPARRRFLKSDSVEKNHLLNEFYRIVLVNPEVEFTLYDGEDEVFQLPPVNIKVRIEQVFGNARRKLSHQLLNIETDTSLVRISGFISRPEFAQKSAQQYFFVNGRYMRHPYFHRAVTMAYSQLIQPTENPPYFIYFEVDPQTIDINIHPTKTEIKFENEQAVWSILSAAVKEALGKFNIVPSIDFDTEGAPPLPVRPTGFPVEQPRTNFNPDYNPFAGSASSYKRTNTDWERLYQGFGKDTEPVQTGMFGVETTPAKIQMPVGEHERSGYHLQVKYKYIATSVKSGMLLIDQRRAHVRILTDQFLREIQQRQGHSQQLIFPEVISLMPDDELFFNQVKQELMYAGFDFAPESPGNYQIKGIPSQMKDSGNVVPLLQMIVEEVKQSTGDGVSAIRESIARQLAESAAIRAGQSLSDQEMSDLVDRLFACEQHHYGPDGKPVMVIISDDDIQSRFR
jgi:DNA mismatch repair protein MutL